MVETELDIDRLFENRDVQDGVNYWPKWRQPLQRKERKRGKEITVGWKQISHEKKPVSISKSRRIKCIGVYLAASHNLSLLFQFTRTFSWSIMLPPFRLQDESNEMDRWYKAELRFYA